MAAPIPKYDRILDDLREKDTEATTLTLTDSNGVQWTVTVDATGHLVTTQVVTGGSVWLSLGMSLMP